MSDFMNMMGYFYNQADLIARAIAANPDCSDYEQREILRRYGINPNDLTERDIEYINKRINVYLS